MTQLTNRQLDILAAQIRSTVGKMRKCWVTTCEIALDLGEKLNRAKDSVIQSGGTWSDWVEENCEMSQRTAQRFMKMDREKQLIENQSTIQAALNDLSKVTPTGGRSDSVSLQYPERVASQDEDQESAAGEGGAPGGNGQGPVAHEEWDDEKVEEEPIAKSKPAWQVQADRHRVWVNDLNRIRREVKACEDEYDYMRHCSLRVIQDLRQVVATLSQNTPVDETWKTKGELESRRR